MLIATWNVNSIRAREQRVVAWLEQHRPDVVCLQETKVVDEAFPREAIEGLGYRIAHRGSRAYNGVAILAREDIADVDVSYGEEARLIAGTVRGVRCVCVYVPNGKVVGHEAWHGKLDWLRGLRGYLERTADPAHPVVLCGDFNVAPDDRDVHDPAAWRGQNLASPDERAALQHVVAWGFTDAFRHFHPEPGYFSWWDYRLLAFPKNRGLRIDLAYVTAPVLARLRDARIDRDARKGKLPSDHAPVVLELAD